VPAPGALDVGAAPGARAVTTGPAPGTLPLAPGPLSGAQAAGGTGRGSAYSGSEEASGEASEAAIVAGALRALRSERSAERALARLDEHARRFPGGPLALEAAVVRAEALLSLDRPREALAVLERLPSTGQRIDRELIVARGELRARLGACGAARLDFEEVLAGGLRDVFDERALYGLGSCRLQIGDRDGALAALSRYLSLYPAGRFATAVRRALEPPGAAGARP
jgi:tetratricopeptide (TPR) repeat protein